MVPLAALSRQYREKLIQGFSLFLVLRPKRVNLYGAIDRRLACSTASGSVSMSHKGKLQSPHRYGNSPALPSQGERFSIPIALYTLVSKELRGGRDTVKGGAVSVESVAYAASRKPRTPAQTNTLHAKGKSRGAIGWMRVCDPLHLYKDKYLDLRIKIL